MLSAGPLAIQLASLPSLSSRLVPLNAAFTYSPSKALRVFGCKRGFGVGCGRGERTLICKEFTRLSF